LDALGFVWDPLESAWEEGFAILKKFKAREGHCLVPALHCEGKFRVGGWVRSQRHRRSRLTAEQKQRLDALGFVWDPLESAWEEGFAILKKFKAREGHCLVPQNHIEESCRLGAWVTMQRTRKKKKQISDKRLKQLDDIGFIWDPHEERWEQAFAALGAFKTREGHCRVPRHHVEGTIGLGRWVEHQRENRVTMSPKHRRQLDDLGFIWDATATT
jgi:Helicase associated domain